MKRSLRRRNGRFLGWAALAAAVLAVAGVIIAFPGAGRLAWAAEAGPAAATPAPAAPAKTAAPRPERVVPGDLELLCDVEYGKVGDRALKLDILRPKEPQTQPMPVIVYVHGGAWKAGSKEGAPGTCIALARKGYLVVSVGYRLSQEAIWPAQIEDCKCAVRFLRAHAKEYNIDPGHVGAWGHSAGGHLVAMLGTAGDIKELEGKGGWEKESSRVQAVLDCFGPTDFAAFEKELPPEKDWRTDALTQLLGVPAKENRDKAAQASPMTFVTKDDPPFLIMHGDKDPIVPLSQSELMVEALKKVGVEATLHVVKGAGHGFGGREIDEMTAAFFDKHLKPAATAVAGPVTTPKAEGN